MASITIQPSSVHGSIRPPGSKSLTNRALVCAALSHGPSTLSGALDSEDTQVMVDCLDRLGVPCEWDRQSAVIHVQGQGGALRGGDIALDVHNSGTTIRFLTAVVATGRGRYRLDGNERMRCRPIGHLVTALQQLGVAARCLGDNGCPPVLVDAAGLPGGEVTLPGNLSSQFFSGLLLAAPCAQGPLTLRLADAVASTPYVTMTEQVMQAFGIQIARRGEWEFHIEPQQYRPACYAIEPDASAASYFWAAAAITQSELTVEGLTTRSLQGDLGILGALAQMGCIVDETAAGIRLRGAPLRGVDVDMRSISDTVPTLAVVALFAQGPTTIRGVAHIRHKESDRIGDLARELRKLGAIVQEYPDGLQITPGRWTGGVLQTYDDHRLAMSFALAGLRIPGVTILDPDCTAKTYPGYFADLARLCSG